MGIIKKLSCNEIKKIAAGQVVERPASVVKELIENALDAQATVITIYIEHGGHTVIRVIDNGNGMDAQDAHACFDNHATSKLTTVDELASIHSYGFRGEALASIAAVSKVTLHTMQADACMGTAVTVYENSVHTDSTVMAVGTDITVRDLFFNVPARQKFLKKEESEWRAILQVFQALCLAYVSITFKIFSNNVLMRHCPATTSLQNRFMQLFDECVNEKLLVIEPVASDAVGLHGVISHPQISRYNKNHIFFLINQRPVKNYSLANALIKGYAQSMPEGRYPLGVMHLTIDPALIDINVDPRKEEIRLAHPRTIERYITEQIKKTLEQATQKSLYVAATSSPDASFDHFMPNTVTAMHGMAQQSALPHHGSVEFVSFQGPAIPAALLRDERPFTHTDTMVTATETESTDVQLHVQDASMSKTHDVGYLVGILHNTYLLVQQADQLVVIDQHAAHERILFEQCARVFGNPESVTLLFPLVIPVAAQRTSHFSLLQPLLKAHGIEVDIIGQQELIVRATPIHLKHIDYQKFIEEALNCVQEFEYLEHAELHRKLNYTVQAQMACKAAIKAGDLLQRAQAEQLLKDLYTSPNCYTCPHGRPTSWPITIHEIERMFKRRK